jgi:hypothetical protein
MNKVSRLLIFREGLLKKNYFWRSTCKQSSKRGSFEGASDPSNIQREHQHHLDRAKAFNALRAFPSMEGMTVSFGWLLEVSFFFLELLVCSGESSVPKPLAQAKPFLSLTEGRVLEVPAFKEGSISSLPRKIGSWEELLGMRGREEEVFGKSERKDSSSSASL